MILVGQRSLLRPWVRGDAASLIRNADNPNVARHLRERFPHPYTRADADAFLGHCVASGDVSNLAIVVDHSAVGGIGFIRGNDVERYSAEIGYWLGEPYWGKGIATEALQLLTDFLFAEAHLLRLFAVIVSDNAGSLRVIEKAGYQQEAVLRASCVKNGEVRDRLLYSRINPNWEAPESRGSGR